MNGPFIDTLLRLLDSSSDDLDHIVIETTGVADPTAICVSLRKGAVSSMVRIDQIVTVVDSTRVLQQITTDQAETENIALEQINMADTVLVSKIDLIQEKEQLNTIVTRLRGMQQRARIITCSGGQVPIEYLLNVGCSFEYLREKQEQQERVDSHGEHHDHDQGHHDDHDDDHHHNHHDHHDHHDHHHTEFKTSTEHENLMSLSYSFDVPLSKIIFMNRVLPLLTANTLRAKGLLHFYEIEHRRLIFHFTAQRYSFEECKWMVEKEGKEEEASITKTEFVIIGRNLNKLKFDQAFQACLNCPLHD